MPTGLVGLFALMGVAEEELAGVGAPDAFGACLPSPVLKQYRAEPLYRAHVRELGRRFLGRGDPRIATDAEVLASIMLTALQAPLTTEGANVADELCRRVMPDVSAKLPKLGSHESWKGQIHEDIEGARRRLHQPDRAWRRD